MVPGKNRGSNLVLFTFSGRYKKTTKRPFEPNLRTSNNMTTTRFTLALALLVLFTAPASGAQVRKHLRTNSQPTTVNPSTSTPADIQSAPPPVRGKDVGVGTDATHPQADTVFPQQAHVEHAGGVFEYLYRSTFWTYLGPSHIPPNHDRSRPSPFGSTGARGSMNTRVSLEVVCHSPEWTTFEVQLEQPKFQEHTVNPFPGLSDHEVFAKMELPFKYIRSTNGSYAHYVFADKDDEFSMGIKRSLMSAFVFTNDKRSEIDSSHNSNSDQQKNNHGPKTKQHYVAIESDGQTKWRSSYSSSRHGLHRNAYSLTPKTGIDVDPSKSTHTSTAVERWISSFVPRSSSPTVPSLPLTEQLPT